MAALPFGYFVYSSITLFSKAVRMSLAWSASFAENNLFLRVRLDINPESPARIFNCLVGSLNGVNIINISFTGLLSAEGKFIPVLDLAKIRTG